MELSPINRSLIKNIVELIVSSKTTGKVYLKHSINERKPIKCFINSNVYVKNAALYKHTAGQVANTCSSYIYFHMKYSFYSQKQIAF